MKTSGYMVYWVDITGETFFPFHSHFEMNEMSEALAFMEDLRKNTDVAYVTFVSQNPDSVGKPGVSDKLPDDYSWSKQQRGDGQPDGSKTIIGSRSNG
jgi:hypothetical protein